MQRVFRSSPVATLVLASALGCATTEKPAGFEDAARAARRNASSPSHSLYHDAIVRKLRLPLERAGRRCSMRVPDTRGAKLLYRLDASGTPAETILYPDGEFGRCVLQEIRRVALPPPPEPDYWVGVAIPGSGASGPVHFPGRHR